uniref:G-protein coupled receptors family 1 profile domain-containing protein n=1 Tax=Romanomermis culicivorax TaxID=13658 RepID=A0A915KB02_ROMCU
MNLPFFGWMLFLANDYLHTSLLHTCYDYCVRNRNQSTLCGCPYKEFFPDLPSESDPCYRIYSTVLIIFLLPLLACYGIMGNVFNLIIYCQKVMRCSMNCYLALLAAGDLVLALTSVFMFTFEVLGNTEDFIRRLYLSYIKYVFPVGMVAQTCTVYFTVAAGLDCLITVVCRKLVKTFCTVKNQRRNFAAFDEIWKLNNLFAKNSKGEKMNTIIIIFQFHKKTSQLRKLLLFWSRNGDHSPIKDLFPERALIVGVCIMFFAVLYNASRWMEISIIRCFDSLKNATFSEVCESSLRQNPVYKQVYHLHMSTVMMAIGPLIILLIVNSFVIKTVHRRRNWKALAVSTRTT